MGNLVYLAGPIGGCTYEGCVTWRDYAKQQLADVGLIGLSPMRAKEFLKNEINIDDREYTHPVATPQGISCRDEWDCTRSDIVLLNLLGATKVSIGSMIEVGMARVARVPMIVVMEPGGIHEHVMMKVYPGFRVETLDDGIDIAKALLLP